MSKKVFIISKKLFVTSKWFRQLDITSNMLGSVLTLHQYRIMTYLINWLIDWLIGNFELFCIKSVWLDCLLIFHCFRWIFPVCQIIEIIPEYIQISKSFLDVLYLYYFPRNAFWVWSNLWNGIYLLQTIKELIRCTKLKFSNFYIFTTWWGKP